MDEEDDTSVDDSLNLAALFGRNGSSFAALPSRAKESLGTSVYDNVANSIRTAYGKPMTQAAEGQYAQLASQFGIDRGKPDDSEKWLSVAAALFAPTQTGKTSESIARALGAYATATGDQKKEERSTSLALAKLYQRYQSDAMRAEAAAAKAAMPKTTLNPQTGAPTIVPAASQVAHPTSEDEYKALPAGTPYVVPGGPSGGTILYKGVDE